MAYVGSTPAELFGTLNPNSVKTIDIQDDAVTAAKIAAGAVAYADVTGTPTLATVATTGAYSDVTGTPTLATVATTGAYSDVTGTPTLATVATSGSYTDLTNKPTISTTATNIAGGSNGTIPYQSAADTTAMLAAGTAGQVLQTNGAGAPTWVDAGGGIDLLGSLTLGDSSQSFSLPSGWQNTYVYLQLKMQGVFVSSAGTSLLTLRFSSNASNNYGWSRTGFGATQTGASGQPYIYLSPSLTNNTDVAIDVKISHNANANSYKNNLYGYSMSYGNYMSIISGSLNSNSVITSVDLHRPTPGYYLSGTAKLYGVK